MPKIDWLTFGYRKFVLCTAEADGQRMGRGSQQKNLAGNKHHSTYQTKMGISEVKQVKLLAKLLFKLFDDSYEFHLLQLFKRMLLSTLCCNNLNLSLTRNSSLRFYFVSLIFFFLLIRFFNKNNAPNYFLFVFLSYFTLTLTAYALALEFFFSLLFCLSFFFSVLLNIRVFKIML